MRESDLQIAYRLTWFASPMDVYCEVNNGRGPVDFKISRGSRDSALVEFKLASNTQLKRNLQHQVEIYQKASDAPAAIKAMMYFSVSDFARVNTVLKELGVEKDPNIVLIDARSDNKTSASKAK